MTGAPDDRAAGRPDPRDALYRLAGGTLALKIAGQGLMLVLMVALARLLGDRDYGQYVLALAWARVGVTAVKAGFETALQRYLPAYTVAGDGARARGVIRRAGLVAGGGWLLLAAAGGGLVLWRWDALEPGLGATLLAAVAVVLVQAMGDLAGAVLKAWGRPVRAVLPAFVLRPVLAFPGVVLGIFVLGAGRTSLLAMIAMAAASAVGLALLAAWCRGAAPAVVRAARETATAPGWTATALTMLFIAGINMVISQTDTIMVGGLLDATRAGYYGTAVRLSGLVGFGLMAANAVVAPRVAACHAAGDRAGMQDLLLTASRGILAYALPVAAVLVFGGGLLLRLWGEAFTGAAPALAVLAVSYVLATAGGPAVTLMTMTGRERLAATVIGLAAVLNVVLNALLIPRYGLLGAAVATGLVIVLWNASLVVVAGTRLGVRTTVLWPGRRP